MGHDDELVVVGPDGDVYRGPKAFLVCLWALVEYREWSYRFASPTLAPFVRKASVVLSRNRHALGPWLGASDDVLARRLAEASGAGACDDDRSRGGACR